jgi:DNA-binding response OmpR family regulator
MKILYVEDDPAWGNLVKDEIESRGHEVVVVEKASHAIEELSAWRFDRIICDGNLDGQNSGDGFRLGHQLKLEGRDVIFFSADTRSVPHGMSAVNKNSAELTLNEKIDHLLTLRT